MNRKTNLKAVEEKPEQLTWEQLDRLARSLAVELMDNSPAANIIILLMQEVASHPFDNSHVETVANLTTTHLFAITRDAGKAYKELIRRERQKLQKGGAGR